MHRLVAVVSAVVLITSVSVYAATTKSISVSGNLTGGTKVSASCSVSSTGQASGAGQLYGTNNGVPYSYPFNINKVTTSTNTVILSGYFIANKAPVTLTAAVPSGAQTFKYVVNGKTVTYTGTGTVTVK